MYHSEDRYLTRALDPVDDSISAKDHLAEVLALELGDYPAQ